MNMLFAILVVIFSPGTLATFVINANDFFEESSENLLGLRSVDTFDIERYVKNFGYPFETHQVTTADGYILGVHRVPYGKSGAGPKNGPPVLIMHGLLGSSADFFIVGQNKSLALQLADIGYDVWLGNNRGHTWSRKHTSLNPDTNKTYWDFSFHEFGIYDDTAIIDYVLNQTGYANLSYIGHSQGATQFFAMAATKPEYNAKIKVMAGLSPVAYMKNSKNILFKLLSENYENIQVLAGDYNITEFLPHNLLFTTVGRIICNEKSKFMEICKIFYYVLFGYDAKQLNMELLPNLFRVFPAGGSVRELLHFAQEKKSGHFGQYDYGERGNKKTYNQTLPLQYNISQITASVGLFYGDADELVATKDLETLTNNLANLVEKTPIAYHGFNSEDFIYAKDIDTLVNFPLINFLNKFNSFGELTTNSPTTSSTTPTASSPTTPSSTTSQPSSGNKWSPSLMSVELCVVLLIVKMLI